MKSSTIDIAAIRSYLLNLQSTIVAELEAFDGKAFLYDAWSRPVSKERGSSPARPGCSNEVGVINKPAREILEGDGITRVIEDGVFFERGGCNFSHVRGPALPASACAASSAAIGRPFEAIGVSLVLHPRNPYCPTTHLNVRCFFVAPRDGVNEDPLFWFGGGMDLTPFYGFEEDARHFHQQCAQALAPFGRELYPAFKLWCDAYFHLTHRNESRGIGGIFFDEFSDLGPVASFAMTRAVGDAFLSAYLPIIARRRDHDYSERERDFQSYRRGRYVEFNLVQDRGTLFGLQSGGRIESVLMSLPPLTTWKYDWSPVHGSEEARLYSDFLRPRDWVTNRSAEECSEGMKVTEHTETRLVLSQ